MAKLSLWLPPFSPDYSGAAAVLFDLHTVTAMHDGSGCTGNYTGYDEPRWFGSQSAIYCSGLREIDAVLGDDEKLIQKMVHAADDVKPDILGLIGSPVPMVIGSDLKGIAAELEECTGIVSIGLDTTGTAYYDKGAYMAAVELLERFTEKQEKQEKHINILGALPMDFYKGEEIQLLKKLLQKEGYQIGITFAMDYTLEQLKQCASAEVNVAVSRFGYLVAKYMEKEYGIPWICGFPAGKKVTEEWLLALEHVRETRNSQVFSPERKQQSSIQKEILVIGEQVMGNSIRNGLGELGYDHVTVASLYGLEKELMRAEDLDLNEEKLIKKAVCDEKYQMIIADPVLQEFLPKKNGKKFIPFAQYAVSSKLGTKHLTFLLAERFNKWFQINAEEMTCAS